MLDLLWLVYVLPLLVGLLLCLPYRFKEKTITWLTGLCLLLPAVASFTFIVYEACLGFLPYEHQALTLKLFGHHFDLVVWIDFSTIVMLSLTHILGLLVVKYSHGYLHLEKGYQRFFSTILFFIFGMYLLSLAGTVDLFFAAWEIVGFSSFFLIAFYRSHTRSVSNAWRVYSIYRFCDVGLLMSAVLGHVLWHHATRFSEIVNLSPEAVAKIPTEYLVILSLFLVLASLGKSAQFPFHSWPSKAMEGPTPSSAIFYGALSIHAGVFLLVRTYSIWSILWQVKVLLAVLGLLTIVLSTFQGRVQANIKGQIAFAITAQIGLMFIEVSLGFTTFVMIHLFFHALYRCFQLLVSPSIVASSLTLNNKNMVKRAAKHRRKDLHFLPERWRITLYTMALNDFSLDPSWRGFGFIPWRRSYRLITQFLSRPLVFIPLIVVVTLFPSFDLSRLPILLSTLSLYFSLRALFVHTDAFRSMGDLTLSIFVDMVSIYFVNQETLVAIKIFMVSIIPALFLGLYVTQKFRGFDLRDFHALGGSNRLSANLFLLVFMILSGMPVSSAFFGEDIILEELIEHSVLMALFTTLSLMLNGLICVRIYTRLFMGSRSMLRTK